MSTKVLVHFFLLFDLSAAVGFRTNCTLPPEGTNFVYGPNARGTMGILWNCLSIIFICTWNILHLNVPAGRPRPKGFFPIIWRTILGSRAKVKWMFITILVPEYIVGKAFGDWMAARKTSRSLGDYAILDGVEWETIHSYYSDMGGFIVDFGAIPPSSESRAPAAVANIRPVTAELSAYEKIEALAETSAVHGSTAKSLTTVNAPLRADTIPVEDESNRNNPSKKHPTMGGLVNQALRERSLNRSQEINLSRMRYNLWAVDGSQMHRLREEGIVASLPNVPTAGLEKLTRGDPLVKFLAVIQVSWLIIQLITRKIKGLPSSQLEIAALAFSASSIVTYLLFWDHPQNVETVIEVPASKLPTLDNLVVLSGWGPTFLWTGARSHGKAGEGFVPVPNDATHWPGILTTNSVDDGSLTLTFGAIFGGTIFGGLHCLAWNFHFPTRIEAVFWRTCSSMMAALPVMSLPLSFLWLRYNWLKTETSELKKRFVISTVLIGLILLYVLARLFVMIEAFRSLFFLPPEAFIETWSGAFPHWG